MILYIFEIVWHFLALKAHQSLNIHHWKQQLGHLQLLVFSYLKRLAQFILKLIQLLVLYFGVCDPLRYVHLSFCVYPFLNLVFVRQCGWGFSASPTGYLGQTRETASPERDKVSEKKHLNGCFYICYVRKITLYLNGISCRMLIPTTELGRFDSMVMPFELEAYDILKSRSCKQKVISCQY